ncbi:tetratricopeptide repeat protein [Streptomyces sp. NPDC017254]|uniref:tetratricopeptide repeat protein n=1 Tax=unclassified Streptomyces TaxID=2593676 RepID=UPI00378D3904
MTDYALTRLGPQRFEELSQALALKVLGPSVEIFGEGPDGGREASFEGLRRYPTPEDPWTGYGILQAKFRGRPEGAGKDADWLIRQIDSELKAWARPDSNRVRKGRVPEYLLIASNVALSSVPGSGGIDRVHRAVSERVRELALPLKGWVVWHYSTMCRLLDDSRDIRHANADAVLPGDVLALLYEHVKQAETARSAPAPETAPQLPGRNLPRRLRALFGREAEIAKGRRLLERSGEEGIRAVVVTGPPGIGKSAVALGLAHLVSDAYPDGQFHIDLALSAGEGEPVDLVASLLHTLRPGGDQFPEGRAQQLALLSSALSESRVLLLVDDVTSEDSLLEVLRIDGPFAVLCTSRAKLSGLAGLVPVIDLAPLSTRHSEEMVREVAGVDRLTDGQVTSLAEACAGHPLALHIAGAYLARRPKVDVDRFLGDITDPDRGVQALKAGQTALVPVLERSFADLGREQAELFAALGVLPHMSLTTDVVAAVSARPGELDDEHMDRVSDLLDSLFELSLIEQIDEDRYVLHEILHRFARLKSAARPAEARETVVRQACLMLAVRARAATESIGFTDPEATVPALSNADALHILNADRPGAVAVTEMARQYGQWEPLVLLASDITAFLWHGSHWIDLERVYRSVAEAGARSENPGWTATAHHNLAMVASHLGESRRSVDLYRSSAEMAHRADDPHQMYLAELALGSLLINLGRGREAIPILRDGLRFWRVVEERQILAQALGNLGLAHMAIGRLHRAEEYLRASRNLSRDGSPADLSNRGAISALLRRTGRMAQAAQDASQDIARARAVGSREWEAKALMELAETPVEERPVSAPARPLEEALAIYRDTGDAQGQVRALFRLGDRAADRADVHLAARFLGECAVLAARIGDFEHGARSSVYLASYHGGIGRSDEAETYFADALEMARHVGNPGVLALTLQKRAEYLWHLGRIGEAVDHLTEAARHLETTEERKAQAQIKASLGEALIAAGRWREGAKELHSVTSDLSPHASPSTKARAARGLAVLYSLRGLHTEAMTAATEALERCDKAGDTSGVLQCRMALGSVHARNGEWSAALDEYGRAAELAQRRSDVHVSLTARSQAAVCLLNTGETDKAISMITELIPLTARWGMGTAGAALHGNLGTHYARLRAYDTAADEFRNALSLAEQLDNKPLRATCLLNLARAVGALGDTDGSRAYGRQSFALHHELGNWPEAGDALLHLGALHQETTGTLDLPTFAELLGDGRHVDDRVIQSLHARVPRATEEAPAEPGVDTSGSTTGGRRIHVAATVRDALARLDVRAVIHRLGNSRQRCAACNLLIDETGEAELLLLHHPGMKHVPLRLTHPHCARSQVLHLDDPLPTQPEMNTEIECILFGQDRAGVIADCYGGWGLPDDGDTVEDLILRSFTEGGFTNLRSMLDLEEGRPLDFRNTPAVEGGGVEARLEGNRLSITGPRGQELLSPTPLNFYPHWYRKALDGSLIIVFGRNLQGLAADDVSYLLRALILGQAVGATVPLTVVRPRRNSPCPCMMRAGRKFKHCCGSSRALP